MILFQITEPTIDLGVYGIDVPLYGDRALRVMETLEQNAECEWSKKLSLIREEVLPLNRQDLLLAHSPEYVDTLLSDQAERAVRHAYELDAPDDSHPRRYRPESATRPLSALAERARIFAAGTVRAMDWSLQRDFCFYLNSYAGAHHAMSDQGRGFCLINDIVVGLRVHQRRQNLAKAWVIDVDAHMGDGTAELTQGDSTITSLSIHMASGWPLDGSLATDLGDERAAALTSDIDIPVKSAQQGEYLPLLRRGLDRLGEEEEPDLAVVVNGSDPFEGDVLPSASGLQLSKNDLLSRDQMVYKFLKDREIPQCWLMAGGYGDQSHLIYAGFLEWLART